MPATIVIFANGEVPHYRAAQRVIPADAFLIAADGGTRHCAALGLTPHLVIGDLDSTPPPEIARLESLGVTIRRYPRDKDATDLELALDAALSYAPERILVMGGLGGRLDQTLGNLALLTAPALADVSVRLDDGLEEAFFIRSIAEVTGAAGDTLSLIPWGGDVAGVSVDGVRWPLRGETLYAHRSRGISNELTATRARITVQSGLLLCVHTRSLL